MNKLLPSFYLREDVLVIAKELLGKILVTNIDGETVSGRIVETEAYAGELDNASHASKGRTKRTEVIFCGGGIAYIYLCYGLHQMFNVVTGPEGLAHAVLIRAVEPLEGKELILKRSGKKKWHENITSGPGRVGRAFGLNVIQSGTSLQGNEIFILDDEYKLKNTDIASSARIGVEYAAWEYRFYIKNNSHVSGKGRNK